MFTEAPALIVPVNDPLSVATVAPADVLKTTLTGWALDVVAMFPWLCRFTVKATLWPAAGFPGVHVVVPTRSAEATWLTTIDVGFVKLLFALLVSTTVFASSARALTE